MDPRKILSEVFGNDKKKESLNDSILLRDYFFEEPLNDFFLYVDIMDLHYFKRTPFKSFGQYLAFKLNLISLGDMVKSEIEGIFVAMEKENNEIFKVLNNSSSIQLDTSIFSNQLFLDRETITIQVEDEEKKEKIKKEYKSLLKDIEDINNRIKTEKKESERKKLSKRLEVLINEKEFYEKLLQQTFLKTETIEVDTSKSKKLLEDFLRNADSFKVSLELRKRISRTVDMRQYWIDSIRKTLKINDLHRKLLEFDKINKDFFTNRYQLLKYIIKEIETLRTLFNLPFSTILFNGFRIDKDYTFLENFYIIW